MKRKLLIILVLVLLATGMVYAQERAAPSSVVEIKETNGMVTVRCMQPILDEVIVTPMGDREVLIICRTYIEGGEE